MKKSYINLANPNTDPNRNLSLVNYETTGVDRRSSRNKFCFRSPIYT